jgi:hypothetical protein
VIEIKRCVILKQKRTLYSSIPIFVLLYMSVSMCVCVCAVSSGFVAVSPVTLLVLCAPV